VLLFLFLLACAPCEKERVEPHTAIPCADLYDPERVTEYAVVIDPVEWDGLLEEYSNWEERRAAGLPVKPYHPLVSFRYGDEIVTDATIRLKGNPCCSWEVDKMQFVIAFNQLDPDGRFHGVRKLALDAAFYDPSALRERVGLSYFADAGIPAACANHATLTINGELYGTYTNLEFVDDEFIERQFPDEERGALYKLDFITQNWEHQNGTGGLPQLRELYAIDDDLDAIVEAFDIDSALSFWGAEAAINRSDGYWAGSINFFLYKPVDRGWTLFPWDLDNAISYWGPRRNPFRRKDYHGYAGHLDPILEDPEWRERFGDGVREAHTRLDPQVLIDRIDRWDAQIRPLLAAEPNLPYTLEEHDEAVESLRNHLGVRDRYLCGLLR